MKKLIIVFFISLIIAVAGGIYYLVTNLDSLIEAAVEKFGTEAITTPVEVDRVATRLSQGSASIHGVTIANPDGFSLPHAFSLDEISVAVNLLKTGNEQIAIDLINIVSPQVFYEINAQRQGSLNVLKDKLGGGTPSASGTGTAAEKSPDSQAEALKIDIARFSFSDASLHAKIVPLDNKTYDLKLPTLVLTNLSGTPEQISRQVLDKLIEHTKKEIRKQGLDKELDKLKARAQQRVDEEKAKLEQQADERIDAEKQKAEDKLKNLLGR